MGRVTDFLPDWDDLSFSEGRMGIYPVPVSSLLHAHKTPSNVDNHFAVAEISSIHRHTNIPCRLYLVGDIAVVTFAGLGI